MIDILQLRELEFRQSTEFRQKEQSELDVIPHLERFFCVGSELLM